jgi:hypothetical protein
MPTVRFIHAWFLASVASAMIGAVALSQPAVAQADPARGRRPSSQSCRRRNSFFHRRPKFFHAGLFRIGHHQRWGGDWCAKRRPRLRPAIQSQSMFRLPCPACHRRDKPNDQSPGGGRDLGGRPKCRASVYHFERSCPRSAFGAQPGRHT